MESLSSIKNLPKTCENIPVQTRILLTECNDLIRVIFTKLIHPTSYIHALTTLPLVCKRWNHILQDSNVRLNVINKLCAIIFYPPLKKLEENQYFLMLRYYGLKTGCSPREAMLKCVKPKVETFKFRNDIGFNMTVPGSYGFINDTHYVGADRSGNFFIQDIHNLTTKQFSLPDLPAPICHVDQTIFMLQLNQNKIVSFSVDNPEKQKIYELPQEKIDTTGKFKCRDFLLHENSLYANDNSIFANHKWLVCNTERGYCAFDVKTSELVHAKELITPQGLNGSKEVIQLDGDRLFWQHVKVLSESEDEKESSLHYIDLNAVNPESNLIVELPVNAYVFSVDGGTCTYKVERQPRMQIHCFNDILTGASLTSLPQQLKSNLNAPILKFRIAGTSGSNENSLWDIECRVMEGVLYKFQVDLIGINTLQTSKHSILYVNRENEIVKVTFPSEMKS